VDHNIEAEIEAVDVRIAAAEMQLEELQKSPRAAKRFR